MGWDWGRHGSGSSPGIISLCLCRAPCYTCCTSSPCPPPPRLEFWADFKFLEKTKIKPRNLNPLGTTANFFYFILLFLFVLLFGVFFVVCCFFF